MFCFSEEDLRLGFPYSDFWVTLELSFKLIGEALVASPVGILHGWENYAGQVHRHLTAVFFSIFIR